MEVSGVCRRFLEEGSDLRVFPDNRKGSCGYRRVEDGGYLAVDLVSSEVEKSVGAGVGGYC